MHRCQVTGSVRFQVPLKAHLLTISCSVSARRYRESCVAFSISNLTSTCTLSYSRNLLQEGYKQTWQRTSYRQFFHGIVCPSLQLCRRGSWVNLQSKITRHQMENVFQAYSPTAPTHSTALEYQQASGIGWKFIVSNRALYLNPCISPESEYCPFPTILLVLAHMFTQDTQMPFHRWESQPLTPVLPRNTFLVVTTVLMHWSPIHSSILSWKVIS